MKRYQVNLPQEGAWGSTVSKYDPHDNHVGADDFTSGSKNFETEVDGTLSKRPGDVDYETSTPSGSTKDLYEAVFTDGTHHLLRARSGNLEYSSGNGVFNLVTAGFSPLGNFEMVTQFDRVYMGNGIDTPQVYDKLSTYGGVSYTAPKTKEMGLQAPLTAPTVVVGAAGDVPAGTYQYKVTYVYYGFEESNGSPASAVVSPAVSSQVDLTAIPVGGYGVTDRKIYRTNDSGLTYRLVGTISNNTATTFTDNTLTATAFIPTDNSLPRNFSLIAEYQGRLWVAGIPGAPSEIDYSSAGIPDAWPADSTVLAEAGDPVKAIVVYNNRLVVLNKNSFGQITGTSPDTYAYYRHPGRVGCADNRTVQIRVVNGIPVLMWLGDKKFYMFNGSSVQVVSDDIEDLLQVNIQQASSVRGSNSQASQLDFQSGYFVPNGGIDLTSNPGVITTVNPKYQADEQAEWEQTSDTVSTVVTRRPDIINSLAMPKNNAFSRTAGSLSGAVLSGGNVTLPSAVNDAGQTISGSDLGFLSQFVGGGVSTGVAYRHVFSRAGSITQLSARVRNTAGVSRSFRFAVWSDSAGSPSAVIGLGNYVTRAAGSPVTTITSTVQQQPTLAPNVAVSAGQAVWVGIVTDTGSGIELAFSGVAYTGVTKNVIHATAVTAASPSISGVSGVNGEQIGWVFSQTIIPAAGTWTTAIHDSGIFPHAAILPCEVLGTSSTPSGTTISVARQFSDSPTFVTFDTTPGGGFPTGGLLGVTPARRYWRLFFSLSTSDDRNVPAITSDPSVAFSTTQMWVSPSIDNTLGILALNQAVLNVGLLPVGTTATLVVQKSTATSGPFTDEGTFPLILGTNTISLATVTNPLQRFTRLKITMTNAGDRTKSPEIASVLLKWTISTNFYSQVIDTGAIPAGWDVFQANATLNGGSVGYAIRSAATALALSDDMPSGPFVPSFTSVTNGTIPVIPTNSFVQWCASITSTADNVPMIDSVQINWFISLVSSIRAASTFIDQEYYCSLATFNSLTNNIILKFDRSGNWRVWRDQSASAFSHFFDDTFFADGVSATVRKFRQGITDHGNAIEMDVRLKAFDFEDLSKIKSLRQVFLIVENTGATYDVSYSFDVGGSYLPLVDATGATTFTVPLAPNTQTVKRLVPLASYANQGKSVLVRIHEVGTTQATIQNIKLDVYVREGDVING